MVTQPKNQQRRTTLTHPPHQKKQQQQEYNLCFTTIENWPAYAAGGSLTASSNAAAIKGAYRLVIVWRLI